MKLNDVPTTSIEGLKNLAANLAEVKQEDGVEAIDHFLDFINEWSRNPDIPYIRLPLLGRLTIKYYALRESILRCIKDMRYYKSGAIYNKRKELLINLLSIRERVYKSSYPKKYKLHKKKLEEYVAKR